MADGSVAITAGAGTPIRVLTGLGTASADQQVVTLADSAGNLLGTVGAPLPAQTVNTPSATGTITSTALALTSWTVLAANSSRKGAVFFNDSPNTVWLALASTASTTAYTVQLPSGAYYELPGMNVVYTGIVTGIALAASGNVMATELT